jgi:hypothetical protein
MYRQSCIKTVGQMKQTGAQVYSCKNGQKDIRTNGQTNKGSFTWTDEQTEKTYYSSTNEQTNAETTSWTHGQMSRLIDRQMHRHYGD